MRHTTFAFVGAGALGQSFAALLAASGHPVTILTTEARMAQLQRDRYVKLYGARELAVPVVTTLASPGTIGITADPTRLPAVDGLIFTTKAHQLLDAVAAVRRAWGTESDHIGWGAGAQNGLVKDSLLIEAFGLERSVGMVTIMSAQRDPDGKIYLRSTGTTYLGEFAGGGSARVAAATAALSAAGIPAIAADDIESVLWTKACHAAGVFGASAPTGASIPAFMASPHLGQVYLALARESATIAAAYGATIRDYAGFPVRTYLDQPDSETLASFAASAAAMRSAGGSEPYASMAQDVVSGRTLEVDQIFGDLVARAERAGLEAPRLTLIRDILRGIDAGRSHARAAM